MKTFFSILLILQFLIVVSHDWLDIPGWITGSRVQAVIGRNKILVATLINAIFPGIAVAFALVFWTCTPAWYAPDYWVIYCAITMSSAIAMWYIPYFFGTSEDNKRLYAQMYEGTHYVLPARGDNPNPNLFHILLHVLFATTLILSLALRFHHA